MVSKTVLLKKHEFTFYFPASSYLGGVHRFTSTNHSFPAMIKLYSAVLILLLTACTVPDVQRPGDLVSINGTELFVHTIGEGEPVLFLHGGPGLNHSYFLPHLEPLAVDFQLIFFDMRGMGLSDTSIPPDQFSLDLIVDDIEALKSHFGFDKIHLLAHSWGGLPAMKYIIKYPESLKSVILTNSVPASTEFMDEIIDRRMGIVNRANMERMAMIQDRIQNDEADHYLAEEAMLISFQAMFYDTSQVHQLQLNLGESYGATQRLLMRLPRPSEAPDLHPELAMFEEPVLIIRAEMEPIPPSSDEKLSDTFQKSTLISIDRAGHFPFIEQQAEFNALVSRFLKDVQLTEQE
jgi:proline iminopeptidase